MASSRNIANYVHIVGKGFYETKKSHQEEVMPLPKKKDNKGNKKCDKKCRHAEYYDLQSTFDSLYAKSKDGGTFDDLMSLILSRENILLAYRNIRANKGSMTPGADGLTIEAIEKLGPDEVVDKVRSIMTGSRHGYRPKPVRRVEIPKPYDPSKKRPLGIPCIWDRLIQQCVSQVMEPICEAHFSMNSHGFRPNRSVENAIASVYHKMNLGGLSYVVEFDVKSFFDCVDHSKLIRQIWTLGIRDKTLLYIIERMLKAPIMLPDRTLVFPERGTPQGGLISPLLANICLNELDKWIEGQWEEHPLTRKYKSYEANGELHKTRAYSYMRNKTGLTEMYIVRYADDFRIFCRTRNDAEKILESTQQWLSTRLRLEVSPEKTRIVNLKNSYMEFLGFKIKLRKKRRKWVIHSHVSDKKLAMMEAKLVEQAKNIAHPRKKGTLFKETTLYNSMVMGEQNYYKMASEINIDAGKVNWRIMKVFTARLKPDYKKGRLHKTGRKLTAKESERYGDSALLRYDCFTDEPIYPIGCVSFCIPRMQNRKTTCFSTEGRENIHDNLQIDTRLMHLLMRNPPPELGVKGADACISKFSAQWGCCAITKEQFDTRDSICCHLIVPKNKGGNESFRNIILVKPIVHDLLTMEQPEDEMLYSANLSGEDLDRLNIYRTRAGLPELEMA